MTDTIRGTRPKLSINGAARRGDTASVHHISVKREMRTEPPSTQTMARAANAPSTGTARGIDLASVLGPVCSHFGADDDKAAELDAFARKLLEGTTNR